jgi:hypothetical protein
MTSLKPHVARPDTPPSSRAQLPPDIRYQAVIASAFIATAAWTIATTLYIDMAAYSPLPWGDHWDYLRSYFERERLSPSWLFGQHNEHRIATARLFYTADLELFGGRNVFLLASIVATQAIHACLLYRLGIAAARFSRAGAAGIAGLTLTTAFSSQQYTNFTWAFQLPFVMVFLFASTAHFALMRYAVGEPDTQRWKAFAWLGTAVGAAWAATYTLANGLVVWPALVLLGWVLGVSRRVTLLMVITAAVAWATYMADYATPVQHGSIKEALYQTPRVVVFALAYLGTPVDDTVAALASLFGTAGDNLRAAFGATAGLVGVWLFIRLATQWLKNPGRFNAAQVVLLHLALFIGLTAIVTALGRATTFGLVDAMTSRYATPALMFWTCLAILVLSGQQWRQEPRDSLPPMFQTVLALLVGLIAINQAPRIAMARGASEHLGEVENAIRGGVYSPELWGRIYYNPQAMLPVTDVLKQRRLSIFRDATTSWPGQPLTQVLTVASPSECMGHVDSVVDVPNSTDGGVEISGWAWDARQASPPEQVVLADESGVIRGVATNIVPRPDVVSALPATVDTPYVGWRGFVVKRGSPTQLTAYLVGDDGRTACAIGAIGVSAP